MICTSTLNWQPTGIYKAVKLLFNQTTAAANPADKERTMNEQTLQDDTPTKFTIAELDTLARIKRRRPQVERLVNTRSSSPVSWMFELLQEYVNDDLPAAYMDGDGVDNSLLDIMALCQVWLEMRDGR